VSDIGGRADANCRENRQYRIISPKTGSVIKGGSKLKSLSY